MIVRILGEGQLDVAEDSLDELNALDAEVQQAIEGREDERFAAALTLLLERVRALGKQLPDDALVPSDFVLPGPDASLDEVRELLSEEGLIPG